MKNHILPALAPSLALPLTAAQAQQAETDDAPAFVCFSLPADDNAEAVRTLIDKEHEVLAGIKDRRTADAAVPMLQLIHRAFDDYLDSDTMVEVGQDLVDGGYTLMEQLERLARADYYGSSELAELLDSANDDDDEDDAEEDDFIVITDEVMARYADYTPAPDSEEAKVWELVDTCIATLQSITDKSSADAALPALQEQFETMATAMDDALFTVEQWKALRVHAVAVDDELLRLEEAECYGSDALTEFVSTLFDD